MIIKNLQVKKNNNQIKITVLVNNKILFYEFPAAYEKYISETYDCFLIALLPVAMINNKDIHIEGAVSEKLLYNVNNFIMKLLNIIIPQCKPIKIFVDKVVNNVTNKIKAVGCGLSCGVDSLCCLEDNYFNKNTSKSFKITHVTNFYCGATNSKIVYNKRLKNIKNYINKTKLKFLLVNSNITSFNGMSHVQIHIFRNCSVPLLFQNLFSKYYYASAFSYEDCKIFKGCKAISFAEPYILPLLSTENTELICQGSQYTRVEKIALLSKNILSHEYLDVCVSGDFVEVNNALNCSACWKCMRTMLALDYYKLLDKYKNVFNLNKYKLRKQKFLKNLSSDDPLQKEIIKLYFKK